MCSGCSMKGAVASAGCCPDACTARAGRSDAFAAITAASAADRPIVERFLMTDSQVSEREDEQHATPRGVASEIGQCGAALPDVEWQVRGHVAGDQQSHVTAN